jgi:membrane protein YqaA with SNARE-associated domain
LAAFLHGGHGLRAFFFSIVGYFLTPVGVVLMGALDASLVFYLPFGIDFVVVLVAARHPEWFWLYAVLAAVGSVVGAAGTFWIGKKIGERGLAPFVSHGRLRRVKRSINRGVFVLAGFGVIPPPFTFTPLVLIFQRAGSGEGHPVRGRRRARRALRPADPALDENAAVRMGRRRAHRTCHRRDDRVRRRGGAKIARTLAARGQSLASHRDGRGAPRT